MEATDKPLVVGLYSVTDGHNTQIVKVVRRQGFLRVSTPGRKNSNAIAEGYKWTLIRPSK